MKGPEGVMGRGKEEAESEARGEKFLCETLEGMGEAHFQLDG